jgi:hypothetical protein
LKVGDVFPRDQVDRAAAKLSNGSFFYRGDELGGSPADRTVRWRYDLRSALS